MSAHAGTIFHSLLSVADDEAFLSRAKPIFTYGPGIDDVLGWDLEWEHDMDALYNSIFPIGDAGPDVANARKIIAEILAVVDPVMQHYANHEEFQRAKEEYIKWKKPYYRTRHTHFHSVQINHEKLGTGAPYTERGKDRVHRIATGS